MTEDKTKPQSAPKADDAQEAFDKAALDARTISGLFYPSRWEGAANFSETPAAAFDADRLPPDSLRHWYSLGDDEGYLRTGKFDAGNYRRLFNEFRKIDAGDRLVEIGCSSGRILRWFNDDAERGVEVWGVDIDADSIRWAETNIGSSIHFMTNSTHPHLPFEDRYFDFIYGNSLFTHIGEHATAWMMEVRRVLSDDGVAIFTFNDTASIGWLKERFPNVDDIRYSNPKKRLKELEARGNPSFSRILLNRSPWQLSVWYDQEYLTRLLGRWFDVKKVVPGFAAYQTGYVLGRKR